eukprot:Skav218733  [mRNA]  locus=scaffold1346:875043:876947:+ [translate_table: standard]
MYAPISAPAAPAAELPLLEICSLANAVTLPLDPLMTAGQLRQIIAEKLGIAARCQLWHESETLEKLNGIAQMTVLHAGEPLKPLPKRFEIRLTSSRERFRTGYSSAFTIQYRLRADAEKGELVVEPWRKNDHDTLIYNLREKTYKAGRPCETSQSDALTSDPLAELMARWRGRYLDTEAERFWKALWAAAVECSSSEVEGWMDG